MKAINVTAIPDYVLDVTFDDGVSGMIDLQQFIQKDVFSVLQDRQLFDKVYTTDYSIAWNEELEIDALTIYNELVAEKLLFIEKVNKGLEDVANGRVLDYKTVRAKFLK